MIESADSGEGHEDNDLLFVVEIRLGKTIDKEIVTTGGDSLNQKATGEEAEVKFSVINAETV